MSEGDSLAGVPLRLSSKYYPQPRPQFKEIDIHIPIDALQDDYDFTLERSVIKDAQLWVEERKLEEERKAEKAKRRAEEEEKRRIEEERRRLEEEQRQAEEEERRRIEEEERRRLDEERRRFEDERRRVDEERRRIEEEQRRQIEEERKRVEEEERRRVEEEKQRLEKELKKREEEKKRVEEEELQRLQEENRKLEAERMQNRPFQEEQKRLEKEQVEKKAEERKLKEVTPSDLTNVQPHRQGNIRINLSDFESDTANPFDNVELKSINEMEVLATVLKNNATLVPASQNLTSYRDDQHIPNTNYTNRSPSLYRNVDQNTQQSTQSSWYPNPYGNSEHVYPNGHPIQPHQWNTNSYSTSAPATAPDISGRINIPTPVPTTQMTNQSNIPASTANSFTNYYFPLLTSMTDSRSMRDRQNQYCNNLNQGYTQSPLSGSNPPPLGATGPQQNPYLNQSHSPVQHFPILGSLSQMSSHNNYWSDGTSMPIHSSYNVGNNPTPNGPLANDSLLKSTNSHHAPSSDMSASSTSNGTQQHTLR